MPKPPTSDLREAEQTAILFLWAASVSVAETIPPERRVLVKGLNEALTAVAALPDAIGFGPAPDPATIRPVAPESWPSLAEGRNASATQSPQ
jgi:hypothetical protein